ncbi:MAG: hypothetical protein ABSE51_05570 [Terracidiphilus sp.]
MKIKRLNGLALRKIARNDYVGDDMDESTCPKSVNVLWDRLEVMEHEMRFDGRSYPRGMCKFPFRLAGQGFFPGGDGLWRQDSALSAVRDGSLPIGGVIFLGNDFGTLASYNRRRSASFENVPTWRHIKARVCYAEIPSEKTFFTNAILGLREEGSALGKKSWQSIPEFALFCGEFLRFQLETLAPRLVVILGPHARESFDALAKKTSAKVLYTTHPYADFGLSKDRLKDEVHALAKAWRQS